MKIDLLLRLKDQRRQGLVATVLANQALVKKVQKA